ncbi:carboxylesterase/lipase family protein [Flavilitoribacter nigricans]|uniref:Carboxylic ester hydrolase n=1 Tax=Flavilitoribacter nigricans (strain ATCC 23147 / DSM 23189 / NBRC 102662 / NCIMB 1420 / SS-2) TaxID=1122177 RepID=A0A2D0NBJ2_FLAN2|nr:carboxylesterase family protein [Flavilitoribacter nigricans]PHN05549.1 carboxylesterase [Flavilitoribacter nigricans DSM 23189 = NBRC 102662]
MKKIIQSAILVCCFNLIAMAQNHNAFPVQTTVRNGIIEGNYDTKTGVQKYFGIPYAQPPVGELRWKAPQALGNWEGVKETKRFGPRAVQAPVFGDMNFRSDGISEDCLYLNVWTPADRNTTGLPVLVYFYGGGYVAGDGSEPRYDGESMAQKGIVAVTVNYRLGMFGFYAHPELSAEAPYKASGNYGLLDQQAALQWVHDNIAAFGGDPDKVTIAGESAGSISVSVQMASPLSRDLIAGAIGESGAAIKPTLPPVSLAEAEQIGLDFAKNAGYPSLKELRALSTREVYEIYQESRRFGFPMVIDNYLLPKTLPEIFAAGEQAQVPLLLGWNSAEIPGMAFMQGQPYEEEAFVAKVKEAYPEEHAKVLKLYPHGSKKEIEYSATALASDRFIAYSTWKWFDLHRKNSEAPVYRYLYSKLRPPLVDQTRTSALAGGTVERDPNAPEMPKPIGAPHACEIEYCMGNLHLVDDYAWTKEDYKVSQMMQNYFANFIKTGNPNGAGLVEWADAKAQDSTPPVMIIDTECKVEKATNDGRYEFLDKDYGNQ